MERNSKIIIIFILIIILIASVAACVILKPANLEERTFQNFKMSVPENEQFNSSDNDYSISYTGKDVTIQYFKCNNLTNVICYMAAKEDIIESSVKVNETPDNITEWEMKMKNGETRYICLKEAASTYGACVLVSSSDKDLCMKMAKSIIFTGPLSNTSGLFKSASTTSSVSSHASTQTKNKNNNKNKHPKSDASIDFEDDYYYDFSSDSSSSSSSDSSSSSGSDSGSSSSGDSGSSSEGA